MKKWKYAMTGLLAISVLTVGCGKKDDAVLDPENPVTITVWNYYSGAQQESFNKLVEEFNETRGKEIGVQVESSSEGSVIELEQHVLDAAEKKVGAKELPNIFMAYSDTVYRVDQMGLIEDLNLYFSEEEKAEYMEGYLEEGSFSEEGGMKIFPVAKATEVFALNVTDWEKFAEATGASMETLSTIEGVTETAKAYYEWTDSLTPEENDGKAFYGRDSMANYMISGAAQLGNPIYQKDSSGKVVLNFEETVIRKLWDNYYVPYINGYFNAAGRFRSDDMKTGTVASFVGSSAGVTFFPKEVILSEEESYPIRTEILETPQFADGEKYAVQQGAGMAVTKGEPAEVEGSVEFLKWFTDTERNIQFSVESGYLPVKKEANDLEVLRKELDGNEETIKAIEVSINTLNNNQTVYSMAIENAVDVRNILEYSMSDQAVTDREIILEDIAAGISREEAVAKYDTDEHFREWYEATKAELEAAFNN